MNLSAEEVERQLLQESVVPYLSFDEFKAMLFIKTYSKQYW